MPRHTASHRKNRRYFARWRHQQIAEPTVSNRINACFDLANQHAAANQRVGFPAFMGSLNIYLGKKTDLANHR